MLSFLFFLFFFFCVHLPVTLRKDPVYKVTLRIEMKHRIGMKSHKVDHACKKKKFVLKVKMRFGQKKKQNFHIQLFRETKTKEKQWELKRRGERRWRTKGRRIYIYFERKRVLLPNKRQ